MLRTCSYHGTGRTAAIIQCKRVGAHARGSLIIPHSLSFVFPPLYSTPRISPRFDATIIGRMRWKVDYLDECFDAVRDENRQIGKILSPAREQQIIAIIIENAISECERKYETVIKYSAP